MSYAGVKADFTTLLNRDDMTATQADIFMSQGMSRISRVARLPSLERALLITPTDFAMVQFPIPTDLTQWIDLLVPTAGSSTGQFTALNKVSYRKLMSMDNTARPHSFARFSTQVYLRGAVPIGTQLQVLYYGNASPITDDSQDNELTAGIPDLCIYAALSYAGDYFEHPMTPQWEAKYQNILAEVQTMAMELENEGGVLQIEPTYGDEN